MGIAGCIGNVLQKCGPTTPPTNVYPSTVAAGAPGTFANPLSPPATLDLPDDLAALQGLGALGATAAWAPGEYVELGDASHAYWDGTTWQTGEAPDAPAPPPDAPDPGSMTVAEATAWVQAHHEHAAAMLAAEEAGQNRSTLIAAIQAVIDSH